MLKNAMAGLLPGAALSFFAGAALGLNRSSRPLGQEIGQRSRGKVRSRLPHRRDAGIEAARVFLDQRERHPGKSSSIRKLQRAFRIAGRDFVLANPKAGRRK